MGIQCPSRETTEIISHEQRLEKDSKENKIDGVMETTAGGFFSITGLPRYHVSHEPGSIHPPAETILCAERWCC